MLPSLFASGVAIGLLMIYRVQLGGDAIDLLARGWLLTVKGVWAPLGNSASGGGYVPGGLTALLVGLPLKVWMDYRAPIVLILICHVVAYLILDRLIGEILGQRARLVFAIVYWLNPWRVYQSAWLDNTNYVFVTGAIHLWACYRQRLRPSLVHSALLVAAVGLSAQLHLNALVLVFAAVLLWLRGYWKPHWVGIGLGTLITFGTLVPFFRLALAHPEVIPINRDPLGLSLLRLSPVLKGIVYWFRYASLYGSWESMLVFDFTKSVAASFAAGLSGVFYVLGRGAGTLTLLIPLAANAWLWRRRRKQRNSRSGNRMAGRPWLREYALWCLVGCILANAASPAPAMWWHNLIALHAAVLPVVLWTLAMLRTRRGPWVRRGMAAYVVLTVVLLLGMAFGSEQFMHGPRNPPPSIPAVYHGMQSDLELTDFTREQWPRPDGFFYQEYLRPLEFQSSGDALEPSALP